MVSNGIKSIHSIVSTKRGLVAITDKKQTEIFDLLLSGPMSYSQISASLGNPHYTLNKMLDNALISKDDDGLYKIDSILIFHSEMISDYQSVSIGTEKINNCILSELIVDYFIHNHFHIDNILRLYSQDIFDKLMENNILKDIREAVDLFNELYPKYHISFDNEQPLTVSLTGFEKDICSMKTTIFLLELMLNHIFFDNKAVITNEIHQNDDFIRVVFDHKIVGIKDTRDDRLKSLHHFAVVKQNNSYSIIDHPLQLSIISSIVNKPSTITALSDELKNSRSTISNNIRKISDLGIIKTHTINGLSYNYLDSDVMMLPGGGDFTDLQIDCRPTGLIMDGFFQYIRDSFIQYNIDCKHFLISLGAHMYGLVSEKNNPIEAISIILDLKISIENLIPLTYRIEHKNKYCELNDFLMIGALSMDLFIQTEMKPYFEYDTNRSDISTIKMSIVSK